MSDARTDHRLIGLEPDNLLAFLALLGLLRAIEAVRPDLHPRAYWNVEEPPIRPVVRLKQAISSAEVAQIAAHGLAHLAAHHSFDRADLNHTETAARDLLLNARKEATAADRYAVDMLSALMTDGAIKVQKGEPPIDPTPLCLLFGQGHQHFLDRFAKVPNEPAPPPRGRGKKAVEVTAADAIEEALFQPWRREDSTFSFRWDPEEDVRYALMAGDPTDPQYKSGTQHGANRLACIGLTVLPAVPETRDLRVRATIPGWQGRESSFAWPIWRDPASLSAITGLLAHRDLRNPEKLAHLSIDHVREARRISVGKFMNFTRAQVLETKKILTPKAKFSALVLL
jgi:hypothetical protein